MHLVSLRNCKKGCRRNRSFSRIYFRCKQSPGGDNSTSSNGHPLYNRQVPRALWQPGRSLYNSHIFNGHFSITSTNIITLLLLKTTLFKPIWDPNISTGTRQSQHWLCTVLHWSRFLIGILTITGSILHPNLTMRVASLHRSLSIVPKVRGFLYMEIGDSW